jgi:hypothetical protein
VALCFWRPVLVVPPDGHGDRRARTRQQEELCHCPRVGHTKVAMDLITERRLARKPRDSLMLRLADEKGSGPLRNRCLVTDCTLHAVCKERGCHAQPTVLAALPLPPAFPIARARAWPYPRRRLAETIRNHSWRRGIKQRQCHTCVFLPSTPCGPHDIRNPVTPDEDREAHHAKPQHPLPDELCHLGRQDRCTPTSRKVGPEDHVQLDPRRLTLQETTSPTRAGFARR